MTAEEGTPIVDKNQQKGWWAKKSPLEKKLVIALGLIAALALSFLIVLIVVASKKNTTTKAADSSHHHVSYTTVRPPMPVQVCETEVCKSTAKDLLNAMNKKVNPCDDFYEYACGSWIKNNPPKPDESSTSTISALSDHVTESLIEIFENVKDQNPSTAVKSMRNYYQSCFNETALDDIGVDSLLDLFRDVNGWPILQQNNTDTSHFWKDLSVLSYFGLNLVVDVSVNLDPKNTSKYMIQLDQPSSFGLGRLSLINSTNSTHEIIAYSQFITNSTTMLANITNIDKLYRDVEAIIMVETNIAKSVVPDKARHDANKLYHPMTVAELQNNFTNIKWEKLLLEVMGVGIDNSTVVDVPGFSYFEKLNGFIKSIEERDLQNYIIWRLVQTFGPLTTSEFRKAALRFESVISGAKEITPRNKTCSALTTKYFGFAAASEYVKINAHIDEEKIKIMEMLNSIQKAFVMNLENINWMDSSTKNAAKIKSQNIHKFVSYPNWIIDNRQLDYYYRGLSTEANYFWTSIRGEEFLRNFEIAQLHKNPSAMVNNWNNPNAMPLTVNAMYEPSMNSIHIFAGIIGSPFYKAGRPNYMNYGAIGLVAGHELTHGFDDSGRQYDQYGNLVNWWSSKTLQNFENRTKCMIDQYSNFVDPQTSLHLDGKNTIGENIADNGGSKQALTAYRVWVAKNGEEKKLPNFEDFSSTQMFYLSHAHVMCANFRNESMANMIKYDVHSPPKFRILGTDMNNKEFAMAWKCEQNKTMNPSKRCTIW